LRSTHHGTRKGAVVAHPRDGRESPDARRLARTPGPRPATDFGGLDAPRDLRIADRLAAEFSAAPATPAAGTRCPYVKRQLEPQLGPSQAHHLATSCSKSAGHPNRRAPGNSLQFARQCSGIVTDEDGAPAALGAGNPDGAKRTLADREADRAESGAAGAKVARCHAEHMVRSPLIEAPVGAVAAP